MFHRCFGQLLSLVPQVCGITHTDRLPFWFCSLHIHSSSTFYTLTIPIRTDLFSSMTTDPNECMRQWVPLTGGEQHFKSMIESIEARYAPTPSAVRPADEAVPTAPTVDAQSSAAEASSTVAAVPAAPESDAESATGKRRRNKNKTGPRGTNKKLRVTTNKHAVHGNEVRITIPPVFVGCFDDNVLPVAQRFFEESLPTLMAAITTTTKTIKVGCKNRLDKHAEYARAKAEYDAKLKECARAKAEYEAKKKEFAAFA